MPQVCDDGVLTQPILAPALPPTLPPTLTPTPSPNRTPTLTRYTKVPFETQLMVSNYNCDTMLEQYVATTRHPNPNPALTLTLTPPSP